VTDTEGKPVRKWLRRAQLVIAAVIASVGLVLLLTMWRPALLLGRSSEALSYSIAASADTDLVNRLATSENCDGSKGSFTCTVSFPDPDNDSGTLTATYVVTVSRTGCWTARKSSSSNSQVGANRLSDCLGVRDYYRPLEAPLR